MNSLVFVFISVPHVMLMPSPWHLIVVPHVMLLLVLIIVILLSNIITMPHYSLSQTLLSRPLYYYV